MRVDRGTAGTEEPARAAPAGTAPGAGRRRGTSARLSRDLIVDVYLRLVEAEGTDNVSLRRLGAELGADSTAVYRHFRDKDEILAAAADRLLGQVTEDPEMRGGWRERLRSLLLALRSVYLVHPRALLALQVSPPSLENGFGNVERCLALLREAGIPEDELPIAYEALETYVIGATVFDARATEKSLARWRAVYGALPPDRYPNLVSTARSLYLDVDVAFRYGLDLMLNAIAAAVARRDGDGAPDGTPAGSAGGAHPHKEDPS